MELNAKNRTIRATGFSPRRREAPRLTGLPTGVEGHPGCKVGLAATDPGRLLAPRRANLLVDRGLRPEECFRLRWAENIRDGAIEIHEPQSEPIR